MRAHSELNQGPMELQSIALPLSYRPKMYLQHARVVYNRLSEQQEKDQCIV